MPSLTRRRFLAGTAAIVGAASASAGALRYFLVDAETTIEAIVVHHLENGGLAPGAAAEFARDYVAAAKPESRSARIVAAARVVKAAGFYVVPSLRHALPSAYARRLETVDRTIVTEFLLASSYDPEEEAPKPLEYDGLFMDRVCNPYARFVS